MKNNKQGQEIIGITVVGIILVLGLLVVFTNMFFGDANQEEVSQEDTEIEKTDRNEEKEQGFSHQGLTTNTALHSIELSQVLSGGPGKDGIPAIHEPQFVSITEKPSSIQPGTLGLVVGKKEPKFYGYNILNWHEIVNDTVDGKPVAVTFCPLCGTAIVFDRELNGETLSFGVSGLLYESNLLMYDLQTESLWSQVLGKAVVGNLLDMQLSLVPSSVLTFEAFAKQFPEGKVLSDDTGFSRNYDFNPYGSYETDSSFYFPTSDFDNKLSPKELVFVVPVGKEQAAFVLNKLNEAGSASLDVNGKTVSVTVDETPYTASIDDKEQAGFVAMYFSIAIHNPDIVIWNGD